MSVSLKKSLQAKSRLKKRLILVLLDALLIPLVLLASFSLRFNDLFIPQNNGWLIFPLATLIAIPVFLKLGLYRSILQYFRSQAVMTIIVATLLSTVIWVGVVNLLHLAEIPASVALLFWLGTSTIIIVTRLVAQGWLYGSKISASKGKRVYIYGAGMAGTQLAKVLESDSEYSLQGFIDDDTSIKGYNILGAKVYSSEQFNDIANETHIDEVILAMPSINRKKRQFILEQLEALPFIIRSVPSFSDVASGKLSSSDIKEIDIDDLLGRNVIKPDPKLLPANIQEKVVMVTGAGGSIGSELCRQIITLSPTKLILLEQSEFALYQIEQELEELISKQGLSFKLDKVLGSITNPVLLKRIFKDKGVQTIYHAAAYKHVPLVEGNPVAGLSNNIFGTQLLAKHALNANVETFILISTDKAVRPTNVMGCSKRVAELVLQSLADQPDCKTVFSMVRFGNVLGSSGSVVPKFRAQIKEGGPITVTDKEITRFFMSIPEAVQLVIQAGAMAKGGEVFVLDMGESVKIVDLAKKMIMLAGLSVKDEDNHDGDIEIEYSGLRPGEKLYEELLIGDNVSETKHSRIMQANEIFIKEATLDKHLSSLQDTMLKLESEDIKKELAGFVDGYKPWVVS
ncbi:MAG: nucleoside-diphosphate sugar epimerase/dehydratase [Cocleimonas sp.]